MSLWFYISIFLVLIALIRFLVATINYLTRPILLVGKVDGNPLVSILINLQNEEQSIGLILSQLKDQHYSNIEILIYDNCSIDGDSKILEQSSQNDDRIRIIKGNEQAEGFDSTSYGNFLLAQRAMGDYFIFLDANDKISSNFIANAAAFMQSSRVALLKIVKGHDLVSLGDYITIPYIKWLILSHFPFQWIKRSKALSGLFSDNEVLIFNALDYRNHYLLEKNNANSINEIFLSETINNKNLKTACLLGDADVYYRVHKSLTNLKNHFARVSSSSSTIGVIFITLLTTFSPFLILFNLPFPLALLYFFCIISSRMLISKLTAQSVILNIIFFPLQHITFLIQVYGSYIKKRAT